MSGITKKFPGVIANDRIDFAAYAGCIHALVGENGAGKTTLMNVLCGLVKPDEGTIRVRGEPVSFGSPKDSIANGIGMVHQHFMLVPSYTVAQNIVLGQEPRKGLFLDVSAARARVGSISAQYGMTVDVDAKVADLSVGVRQRVEILKLLYRGLDVLILDEPTAVLTPQESSALFAALQALAKDGRTVILITHKLPEVLAISDHVTVLRKGRVVGSMKTEDVSMDQLAALMVGKNVSLTVEKSPAQPQDEALCVRNLVVADNRGLPAVQGVSFAARSGEILSIAGVEGNGQTELVEALVGLRPTVSGQIVLGGQDVSGSTLRRRREMGISLVPEDRMKTGLALEATVAENLIMGRHYTEPIARRGRFQPGRVWEYAQSLIASYDIRVPHPAVPAKALSGGNLQKMVVAREFSRRSQLYVVAQPTRGVDILSVEFIHQRIIELRDQGAAVLLISTDLDEVFSVSDRILVMYEGQVAGEFTPNEISREGIGAYMTGTRRGSPGEAMS